MSDALARYRMAERQDKDALKRYKDAGAESDTLGALAKYLGLQGYWDRQGRMANEGLQMADQGAQAVRAGNMGGLAGMLLGPAAYIGSPVSALFPERSEVEAATDVPEWSKPLIAGGLETMAIMAPGPKGKGLGKGLVQLADDATDAERAALGSRLEAEAAQTGGQASTVTRDQALRNLTEAPTDPWLKPTPMDNYREAASLRMKIEPLETQLKAALQSKNTTKAAALREKLKAIRDRVAQLSPGGPLLSADRVDEILKAHPNAELSAEDIDKMFPEE